MSSLAPAASLAAWPSPGVATAAPPRAAAGFSLLLLVNAALFLRPAEIVPGLVGLEIYLFLIVACLLFAFPAVVEQLLVRALDRNPLTVCVLGLWIAAMLSHLCRFHFGWAAASGYEYFKIVVYYLLFVGLVTTPERLLRFLFWLAIFASVLALIAILEYHDWIHLPTLKTLRAVEHDQASGRDIIVRRLQATGPFHDPNDFCVLLVVAILLSLHGLTELRRGGARWLWLGPLAILFYAFSLTQSRGGLLALLSGLFAFLLTRFGWRTTLSLAALLLPAFFIALAGRQTDISAGSGTGQERIQIWSDGLLLFREAPLFGVGMNEFEKFVGHVAHNSYLQALVELGLFGGTFFLGAVFLAVTNLRRAKTGGCEIVDPELRRLHPFLTGAVTGYAVGMFSLTLNYVVPTYTILGLAAAWNRVAVTRPATPSAPFDLRLVRRFLLVALLLLVGLSLFVRVFFKH
jgi:O-antigen ligase